MSAIRLLIRGMGDTGLEPVTSALSRRIRGVRHGIVGHGKAWFAGAFLPAGDLSVRAVPRLMYALCTHAYGERS